MSPGRPSFLLRLQQALMVPGDQSDTAARLDLLPFDVGSQRWAVPCGDVLHVMMPSEIVSLAGYSQIPACIVGVVGTDNEMLSVVDAGLLFATAPCHRTLKSRLIVFGEGRLKGFALLVDRINERISSSSDVAAQSITVSAASLHERIAGQSYARKESQ